MHLINRILGIYQNGWMYIERRDEIASHKESDSSIPKVN